MIKMPTQNQTASLHFQAIQNMPRFDVERPCISPCIDSDPLSEGLVFLLTAIEKVTQALTDHADGESIKPLLVDLLSAVRKHRQQVACLPLSWHQLSEYDSYLATLNSFRAHIGLWLFGRDISGDNLIFVENFEAIGCRTISDALMLIDAHEYTYLKIKIVNDPSSTMGHMIVQTRASDIDKDESDVQIYSKLEVETLN
jgi:hypothetical protein